MASISILTNKCVGCRKCVSACPFGAITLIDKKAVIGPECTLCGSCIESCKLKAINLTEDQVKHADISEYKGIWVFAEQRNGKLKNVALELMGQAERLASELEVQVTSVILGDNVAHLAKELVAYGADEVLVIEAPWLKDISDHVYGEVLVKLVSEYKPEILLIGATSNGRSLAPHISATLHTGLTADCTGLEIDKEKRLLLQTRPAFGGNLMATIVCPYHRPQMATVRPKVFKPLEPDYKRTGKITMLTPPSQIEGFVKKIRIIDNENGESLSDADIIIGVGKGIGNAKNIALAQELAKTLGGTIGASRPVVDLGWLPYYKQIGQTGKTVAPKIYIACGISGAVQHIAGLADIETVVAINNDPDAPIFQVANYAIVGDCAEILPQLTAQIKALKSSSIR